MGGRLLEKFEFRDLLNEIGTIVTGHRGMVLGLLVAIIAGYTALDLVSERVNTISGVIVSVFVQYAFLERVLPLPSGATRRYGSLFGSGLLSGLGIMLGLLLLIVPGLYLSARWALTSPFVVAGQRRATEAISASWDATAECWRPLLLAYVLLGVTATVPLGALVFYSQFSGGEDLSQVAELLLINTWTSVFTIGAWLIGAAGYRLMADRLESIEDVFG